MCFLIVMMVAAVSEQLQATTTDPQNPKTTASRDDEHSRRPPLLPSEKDNSNAVSLPLLSRNSTPASNAPSLGAKRSVSVDRRRPAAARPLIPDLDSKNGNCSEVSAATKLLVTSTRSLSVSFQGEAFSLPISKTKVAPSSPNLSSVRKERRRGGGWWCGERSKLIGSGEAIRALQQSMIEERRPSLDGRLSLDLGNSELLKVPRADDGNSVNNELSMPSDLTHLIQIVFLLVVLQEFKNVMGLQRAKRASWHCCFG
ncbi:UNVERIFIED_CONTAM: QWRF motif-containing protein 2 [Sesamum radiatum]|uniref:QWRF motif-containing protein 2 n=1 Tax=Sesamum radiatum TaxID=300843 RepID=A0AAW2U6R2_SESRA